MSKKNFIIKAIIYSIFLTFFLFSFIGLCIMYKDLFDMGFKLVSIILSFGITFLFSFIFIIDLILLHKDYYCVKK